MEAGQSSRPPVEGQRSTWIAFAGVMMVILGSLDALWGLAAIFNNDDHPRRRDHLPADGQLV